MILTPASHSTIVQFVARESPEGRLEIGDVEVRLVATSGGGDARPHEIYRKIIFHHPAAPAAGVAVELGDDELRYERADRDLLEYFFALMISHISGFG